MSVKYGQPLSKVFKSASDLKRGYEFFSNPKTTFSKLTQPSFKQTARQINGIPVVLAVGDTSFLDDDIMELVGAIDSNISCSFDSYFSIKNNLEFDYCIVLAFEVAIELFYCDNIEEYKLIYKITKLFESIIKFIEIYQSNLLESLIQLKKKLPQLDTNSEKIIHWWENGDLVLKDFRDWIVEHRNIGNQEWIMDDELEVILRYYQTNKLLIDCLNESQVSPEVRAVIEDNLFLPLDSSSS